MNYEKLKSRIQNQVLIYIFLAYSLGFLVDLIFYISGLSFKGTTPQEYVTITLAWGFLRMYTPLTATYLSLRKEEIKFIGWLKSRTQINLRNITAFILSPSLVLLSLGIYLIIYSFFGVIPSELPLPITSELKDLPQSVIIMIILVNGYIASITINAFYAFGEEVGWRGFLQEKLAERFDNLVALILTGIIWGGWHFPAMFILRYNNFDISRMGTVQMVYSLLVYTLFTTVVSILIGYIYWTNRNILIASGIHGALNAYWGLTKIIALEDQVVYTDTSSLIALLIVACITYIIYKWGIKRDREGSFI